MKDLEDQPPVRVSIRLPSPAGQRRRSQTERTAQLNMIHSLAKANRQCLSRGRQASSLPAGAAWFRPVKPPPEAWIKDANARKRLTFDVLLAVRQEPGMKSPTLASAGSPESLRD